ncbi:hypothetical protein GGI23_002642 [Coemansia sp. RSA 2559]|nr:hypothetical protein GGI23_002642 [Coemansia sp. RSA 2559]KAJ2858745.1 hypothetical protein GGI22_003266 [Coemansia erecta]
MLFWIATSLITGLVSYRILQGLRPTPSVAGRRVVIVGASSGIGRSMALEYARRGAHLLLCARRTHELHQVAVACRSVAQPGTVDVVVGDVTDRETQLALRDKATGLWDGMVDYLVLNAGAISVLPVVELWDIDVERATDPRAPPVLVDQACADRADRMMRQIMDINLHAPVAVAGLFLPMLARARGSIVVVSSVAALVAAPTRSLYTASKQAVSGYFSALRMEIQARLGVAVTIVYPGTVATDLRQSAVDGSPDSGAEAAGSQSGKLSPHTCACQAIRAAALRDRELVTPLPYRISVALYALAPSLVEYLAKKKYGL